MLIIILCFNSFCFFKEHFRKKDNHAWSVIQLSNPDILNDLCAQLSQIYTLESCNGRPLETDVFNRFDSEVRKSMTVLVFL